MERMERNEVYKKGKKIMRAVMPFLREKVIPRNLQQPYRSLENMNPETLVRTMNTDNFAVFLRHTGIHKRLYTWGV